MEFDNLKKNLELGQESVTLVQATWGVLLWCGWGHGVPSSFVSFTLHSASSRRALMAMGHTHFGN